MPLDSVSPAPPAGNEALSPAFYLSPRETSLLQGPRPPSSHEPHNGAWSSHAVRPEAPAAATDSPSLEAPIASSPLLRRPRDEPGRINLFIPLVFIPLVLYAILATAAVGFLYLRMQTRPPSLWEQIPDVDGDNPGVRGAAKKGASLRFDRKIAVQPLPENLLVKLGNTLRVGELEVTPTKVRRQRVKVFVEGFAQPEPCDFDSLVLTLKLRNVADDYSFTPLDNYFDRQCGDRDSTVPLTVLVAGAAVFRRPGEVGSFQARRPETRSPPVGRLARSEDRRSRRTRARRGDRGLPLHRWQRSVGGQAAVRHQRGRQARPSSLLRRLALAGLAPSRAGYIQGKAAIGDRRDRG